MGIKPLNTDEITPKTGIHRTSNPEEVWANEGFGGRSVGHSYETDREEESFVIEVNKSVNRSLCHERTIWIRHFRGDHRLASTINGNCRAGDCDRARKREGGYSNECFSSSSAALSVTPANANLVKASGRGFRETQLSEPHPGGRIESQRKQIATTFGPSEMTALNHPVLAS